MTAAFYGYQREERLQVSAKLEVNISRAGETKLRNQHTQPLITQSGTIFNRVYGGRGWKSGTLRLAEVAMKATARFLNGAMPIRNRFLWASLREDDDDSIQHGDPLDQGHNEG